MSTTFICRSCGGHRIMGHFDLDGTAGLLDIYPNDEGVLSYDIDVTDWSAHTFFCFDCYEEEDELKDLVIEADKFEKVA